MERVVDREELRTPEMIAALRGYGRLSS